MPKGQNRDRLRADIGLKGSGRSISAYERSRKRKSNLYENTPEVLATRIPAVKEIHVVWMTTGLSCDGDTVSITAASLPSIEDLVMGNIPGLPKVHLHNPVLAYEVGDDFMKYWHMAAEGRLDPFVLVLEGSVPNEEIKSEGYWAAMGTDPHTGQPHHHQRMD